MFFQSETKTIRAYSNPESCGPVKYGKVVSTMNAKDAFGDKFGIYVDFIKNDGWKDYSIGKDRRQFTLFQENKLFIFLKKNCSSALF